MTLQKSVGWGATDKWNRSRHSAAVKRSKVDWKLRDCFGERSICLVGPGVEQKPGMNKLGGKPTGECGQGGREGAEVLSILMAEELCTWR